MHSPGTNNGVKGLLNISAAAPRFGSRQLAAAIRAGLVVIVSLLISQCASAQTYDAVRDWSSQSNPNGVWSYGYLTSRGTPFTLYTAEGDCGQPGISNWFLLSDVCNPHVGHNDTNKQICVTTACAPTQYLAFHPGPNGEVSVVRWTAPSAGRYFFRVKFQGQDWAYPTSTYVYVLRNSKRLLLKAPITSYKLPLLFYPEPFRLAPGETVDFMVDWGKDGNYYGDSTGLEVKIWNLTKP